MPKTGNILRATRVMIQVLHEEGYNYIVRSLQDVDVATWQQEWYSNGSRGQTAWMTSFGVDDQGALQRENTESWTIRDTEHYQNYSMKASETWFQIVHG